MLPVAVALDLFDPSRRRQGLSFAQVCLETAGNLDFLAQLDRLHGTGFVAILGGRRAPIEKLVDEATGFQRETIARFIVVVHEVVWSTLPL